MRRIFFEPDENLPEQGVESWRDWFRRATNAKERLLVNLGGDQERTFEQRIWSDLKDWLLAHVFHHKCAYCETKVSPGAFGDGEHYRPKSRVTVTKNKKRTVVEVAGQPHCGYFWLVYEWMNLLPSCQRCNSSKSDQFPVGKAHVVDPRLTPVELDDLENPLLIHPYRDDPSALFRFGIDGAIAAIDDNPKGLHTIEVFHLNREPLREDRKARQEEVYTQALSAFNRDVLDNVPISVSLEKYVGDQAPYCSAVRDYVNNYVFPSLSARLNTAKV